MIAAYDREIKTVKEYNGRQILELLQNTDDAQSDEVLIHLDTNTKTLVVANKGQECESFGFKGIQSLMISDYSSKVSKKYIGNKGLGFRSIINWSKQVTISSNELDIVFSREIVEAFFDSIYSTNDQKEMINERNLDSDTKPIAFLSFPKIIDNPQNVWTTYIVIDYIESVRESIEQQLKKIEDELLLFLNNIKKLRVKIDDKEKVFEKETDGNLVYVNENLWTIYPKNEPLPHELWDKKEKEEYFDLRLALQDNLEYSHPLLYSYFPTQIDINFPFIVHGTFELNSSRNEIIDSPKNRYILEKLVELIVSTAKQLTQNEVSYKALEMLTYSLPNNILEKLGFYEAIDRAIDKLEIFPCLDGQYRTKEEVVYANELSIFIEKTQYNNIFPNYLIPADGNIDLDQYNINGSIDDELLNLLSTKITNIDDRAELVYLLHNFTVEDRLVFLIDSNRKLIPLDDDVYTPAKLDLSIPDYVKIKFMHQELFEKLIIKFGIDSKEKARDLQRNLKEITNIQSYEPAQVLQKIVTSTNKELEKDGVDQVGIIKEMLQSLYENYMQLDRTKIPSDTKIQLLNQDNSLTDAKNLFLSRTYPSGVLTSYLFGDIFSSDEFLADMSIFEFTEDDEVEDIEQFFLWLGVNRISKVVPATHSDKITYSRLFFNSIKGKPDYADHMSLSFARKIYNLDEISKQISLEKFIIWCIKDKNVYESFDARESIDLRGSRGGYINSRYCDVSYIYYQLLALNMFKDYLIGNDKLSSLINSISFDFNHKEFETYKINKADIESMLLKIGAIDKFEKLTIDAVGRIVKNLPTNSPEGKQAQSIYKLCIKHFELNKTPLNDDGIMLFAKKDYEKGYFNFKDVFYSATKLPNNIINAKAVLDYPGRLNATNVINFFGINNFKLIDTTVTNQTISQLITNEFKTLIKQIEEYILVYRIKDSPADSSAYEAVRRLKSLNILLCDNVQYKIDEEEFELDVNDYIKYKNDYFIKVDSSKSLNNIKNIFEFQESFADIMGLVFDIQDTKVFREMIKEEPTYIEKTIRNDIGSDELIRSRDILGISDEYSSFWKTIYNLIDKKYEFNNTDNLLNLIKNDIGLKTNIDYIEYDHLDNYVSCQYIKELFQELNVKVNDFNRAETSHYKIDCTSFHMRNIKQAFENNLTSLKKYLYAMCLENHTEVTFIDSIGIYEHNNDFIDTQAIEYKYELDINYENIVDKFINENYELSNTNKTNIDFDAIYKKNIEQINIEDLNGNTMYLSLLYFEDKIEEIKEYIESEKVTVNTDGVDEPTQHPKPIIDTTPTRPSTDVPTIRKPRKPYKHPGDDGGKKARGNKSEQFAFESLVDEYGKENVVWSALDDDSLGYDMKYKNKADEWKYVEVKTYSGKQFYISRNEKKFAEEHFGLYEIFLVGDEIYRFKNVDFSDEKQFTIIENEFIVLYKLEEK